MHLRQDIHGGGGDLSTLYEPIAFVSFNIGYDSQFSKQTSGLYNVYTIIGQSLPNSSTLATSTNKTVVATFRTTSPKTINYVCVGGGGYTFIASGSGGSCGGAGAGAFYQGTISISADTIFNFVAGGSYNTSSITSTELNVSAGYGGHSNRSLTAPENGNNGSSGGGGGAGNASTTLTAPGSGNPPGTNGGTAVTGTARSGGGGGGAGGAGGNGSAGTGGVGGIGITPSDVIIKSFYTSSLCVGGRGHGSSSGLGTSSNTYGSGGGGSSNDGTYYNGRPGAIIFAILN